MPPPATNKGSPTPPVANCDTLATYPSADGSPVRRTSSFWSFPSIASTPAMSDQSMHVEDSDDASLMERGLKICVEYGSEGLRREILEDESTWLIETLHPKLVAVETAFRQFEEALQKEKARAVVNHAITVNNNDNGNHDEDRYLKPSSYSTDKRSGYEPGDGRTQPGTDAPFEAVEVAAKKANDAMLANNILVEAVAVASSVSSRDHSDRKAQYDWTLYYCASDSTKNGCGQRCSSRHSRSHNHGNGKDTNEPDQQAGQSPSFDLVVGRGTVATMDTLHTAAFWAERRKNIEIE